MAVVDTGCIVYIALFVLFCWRSINPWKCCGEWQQFANYCALLYIVLLASLFIDCTTFVASAVSEGGKDAFDYMVPWLQPFVYGGLVSMWFTITICAGQTVTHVEAIRSGEAELRHDRVVQILALPVVYGTMCVSSATRMLALAAKEGRPVLQLDEVDVASGELIANAYGKGPSGAHSRVSAGVELSMARSETAFMVADLYEAWVLYQFLTLTLDLIWTSMLRKAQSQDVEERAGAQALIKVHGATENLSWLGPYCFLLICVGQAGWSLYTLNVSADKSTWGDWSNAVAQFQAAGFLASLAAIFDVAIVERHFHEFLAGYSPMLKFVTVKILVSFSFFQRGILGAIQELTATMPDTMQSLFRKMPLLGSIEQMGLVEFEIFFAALLMFECAFVAILHWFAWGASEEWYGEAQKLSSVKDIDD